MAINYPNYMPDYVMGETDEERRRRLEAEAAAAGTGYGGTSEEDLALFQGQAPTDPGNTEVQSQQVKTYADGSQEEIVKRQVPAPVAPTATGYGGSSPEDLALFQAQAPQVQPAAEPQPQPQPQTETAPVAQPQVQPAVPGLGSQATQDPAELQRRIAAMNEMKAQQLAAQQAPQPVSTLIDPNAPAPAIGQLPTPGPATQFAGPATASAMNQPFTGQGIRMPAAPAANLQQVAEQMGGTPAPAAAPTFESRFAEASADPGKLLELRKDESLTIPQRQLAGRQAQLILEQEMGPIKGKKEIAGMDDSQMARVLKSRSEEGSWAKLALLGFISPELAGKEAAKLGLNDKWSASTTADGTPVLIKTRDGVPIEGYDATTDKALSAKELVAVTAGATGKLNIVGGTYVSDTLKDKSGNALVGRVVSDEKSGRSYVQTDEGRKPMAGFRPQASSGSLDMQRVAQVQRQNIDLAGDWAKLQMKVQSAAPEAANKYLGEFNAKHKTSYALSQLNGLAPQISLETGQMIQAAPAVTTTTPAVTTTTPAATTTTPAATTTTPAATTVPATTVAPIQTTTGRVSTGSAVSPADIEQQKALNLKAGESQIDINRNLEEQKNKIRMAMPASEQNANRVLNTLNDIVTHPGLDKTVGYPKIMTDVLDKIPSSERRAFRQKYDQLSGQEFLAAYNELRGGGGISVEEGRKAEQAISALKDTGISAKDFKQNMWIFRDAIQVGHDKQRQLIGQPPKYQESQQREEAKAWLRENPNSPKAEAVRKKLVGF
jgi:hypothetical protein